MTDTSVTRPALSSPEFIALIAMMFATIAFAIDAMLPALPTIGAALSPSDPDRAQLVITAFVLGMGVGTFFVGPISDAVGRKPVIIGGFAL
jgi:MFS transporter, DHA1 family, multidrug resistance protein